MAASETAAAQFDSPIRDYRTTITKMQNILYKDALPVLDQGEHVGITIAKYHNAILASTHFTTHPTYL